MVLHNFINLFDVKVRVPKIFTILFVSLKMGYLHEFNSDLDFKKWSI